MWLKIIDLIALVGVVVNTRLNAWMAQQMNGFCGSLLKNKTHDIDLWISEYLDNNNNNNLMSFNDSIDYTISVCMTTLNTCLDTYLCSYLCSYVCSSLHWSFGLLLSWSFMTFKDLQTLLHHYFSSTSI